MIGVAIIIMMIIKSLQKSSVTNAAVSVTLYTEAQISGKFINDYAHA